MGFGILVKATTKTAIRESAQQALDASISAAAKKAAKDMGMDIPSEFIQKVAKDTAAIMASKIDDIGAKALREGGEEAAERLTREEIAEVSEKVFKNTMDMAKLANIDEMAQSSARVAGKQSLDAVKDAQKNFLLRNKKLVVGGVSVITLSAIAGERSLRLDESEYNITSIKNPPKEGIAAWLPDDYDGTEEGLVKIKFTPAQKITRNDTVTFKATNSDPSLDKEDYEYPVITFDRETEDEITIKATQLIKDGTAGTLILHTNFLSQLSSTVGDAAAGIIKPVADVGADVIDTGLGALGLPPLPDMFGSLQWYMYAFVCVCCCLLLVGLLGGVMTLIV